MSSPSYFYDLRFNLLREDFKRFCLIAELMDLKPSALCQLWMEEKLKSELAGQWAKAQELYDQREKALRAANKEWAAKWCAPEPELP